MMSLVEVVRNLFNGDYKPLLRCVYEGKWTLLLIIVNAAIFYTVGAPIRQWFIGAAFIDRPWTIISALFLHADTVHLWMNMIGLFIFGRLIESRLGAFRMMFLYFGAGLVGNLLFAAFAWSTPVIGASGAIMGLVSAGVMLYPYIPMYELIRPLPVVVFGWIGIALDIMGLLSVEQTGIAHLAHLGGYFSVFVLIEVLAIRDENLYQNGFLLNGVTFFLSFGVSLFMLVL